jgi:hypothetical protein
MECLVETQLCNVESVGNGGERLGELAKRD